MNVFWSKNIPIVGDYSVEVELSVKVDISRDGIGPYEFWGQRGFDEGGLVADIMDYTVLRYSVYKDTTIIKELPDMSQAKRIFEKHFFDRFEEDIRETALEDYDVAEFERDYDEEVERDRYYDEGFE